MRTLYQRIRELREALGMSQGELAQKTGYSTRSSIAKIETGEHDINISKVSEFARALHTTPAYLMGWDADELPAPTASKPIPAACTILPELSPDEEWLLAAYRSLSPAGKSYLKEQLSIASKIFPKNTQAHAENIG